MTRISEMNSAETDWKPMYKIGGIAALSMAALTIIHSVLFIVSPPPLEGSAADWFAFFQSSPILGLLGFEFLLVIYVVLAVPVSLALFAALRKTDRSLTALFLVLSIVGTITFIAARPAFEMLFLSSRYAAATTDAQKTTFLAAGETMIALFKGTAFQTSYLLGSITGILISIVMLKSGIFGKAIPWLRLASSVLDFGIYIPTIGLFISLFSVVFLLLFNILTGRRLLRIGSAVARTAV